MLGKNKKIEQVNTLIGTGTNIEGKIISSHSIRVDGHVIGEIKAEGNVIIGKTGVVTGNIYATDITVEGQVDGNITSTKNIFLTSVSKLFGDITADSIEIEQGAIFNGRSAINTSGTKNRKEPASHASDSAENNSSPVNSAVNS